MRILDRYITKSILIVFFFSIMIFCLLFLLIDSASNLDEFIDRKTPMAILFQYYLAYLPTIIIQTSSLACLIAVLFAFTDLNAHNEIIVLRASGLSFWKIAKPALWFSCIVAALVFMVNEQYIPSFEEKKRAIENENMILEIDRARQKAKIKGLTFYGLKNRLYFIDSFDPNTYEIENITIIGYDGQQNIKEKIVALNGKWTGLAWKFFRCHITTFPKSAGEKTKIKVYQEKLLDIKETPTDFLKQRLNVSSMNISQLRSYITRFASSGAKRALNNLRVDFHQKIAFPFGIIVIVLVGLPLALMTGRRQAQTFVSLGLAITIGFLYYVCNAVGLALGKGAFFPPILAAWSTPLIFTGIAISMIKSKF